MIVRALSCTLLVCSSSLLLTLSPVLFALLYCCAASPVTEAEFKMFKQAMGEQGLTKSSTKQVI